MANCTGIGFVQLECVEKSSFVGSADGFVFDKTDYYDNKFTFLDFLPFVTPIEKISKFNLTTDVVFGIDKPRNVRRGSAVVWDQRQFIQTLNEENSRTVFHRAARTSPYIIPREPAVGMDHSTLSLNIKPKKICEVFCEKPSSF